MDKKRISFLFGAGAEGKNNYSFPNGFEYMQKSLFDEVHKTRVTNSLKKFFVFDYYHEGYRYTANTVQPTITSLRELVLQKIKESVNNGFYNKFRYYILSIFSKTSIDDIKNEFEQLYNDYHNKEIKRSNSVDRIVTEYKSIISGSINKYSDIKNSFLKELFDQTEDGKIGIDFDCHIGSILDSYFHTIINPPKYGYISFSRIFNYYWQCYFTIAESIVKLNSYDNRIAFFLDENGQLDYFRVLSNIVSFSKVIYNVEPPYKSSYYTEINKRIRSEKYECSGIITTNYYNLCEQVSKDVKAIYLNGMLSQFEFPENIDVVSIKRKHTYKRFEGHSLFFPFIFGQSLVKPIVHSKQVNEYSKFKKCLDRSDILVVIGYNMNSDDNHINSYLREYVMTPKKSIIVLGSTDEKTITKQTQNKLHLPSCNNIKAISVNYNDEFPKTIVGKLFDFIDSIV